MDKIKVFIDLVDFVSNRARVVASPLVLARYQPLP
jgi:hypothetical protein